MPQTFDEFVTEEMARIRSFANAWRNKNKEKAEDFPMSVKDENYYTRNYLSFTARALEKRMESVTGTKETLKLIQKTEAEKNAAPEAAVPDHPAVAMG